MKKSVTTTLSLLAMSFSLAVANAATIATPAGSFTTPNNVDAVSLSQSQTLQLLKSNPKVASDTKAMALLDQIGKKGDIYQLQGKDKGLSKTAFIAVYNAKEDIEKGLQATASKAAGLDKVKGLGQYGSLLGDFGASIINQQFHDKNGGLVIPDSMRDGLVQAGNQALKNAEYVMNKSFARNHEKHPNDPVETIKLEGMELIHTLDKTQYPTYTAGSRMMYTVDGFQMPYYVKAYVVMNPQAPTAIAVLTSDVERSYFQPMLDKAVGKLK